MQPPDCILLFSVDKGHLFERESLTNHLGNDTGSLSAKEADYDYRCAGFYCTAAFVNKL